MAVVLSKAARVCRWARSLTDVEQAGRATRGSTYHIQRSLQLRAGHLSVCDGESSDDDWRSKGGRGRKCELQVGAKTQAQRSSTYNLAQHQQNLAQALLPPSKVKSE